MKGTKRIISNMILCCLLLMIWPLRSYAAEEVHQITYETGAMESDASQEELYESYIGQVFYGNMISVFRRSAGDGLSGDAKLLYDAVVPYLRQIADGERESAVITVGQPITDYNGTVYAVDTEAVFQNTSIGHDMIMQVLNALLTDFPYECYWYDKTQGCSISSISYGSLMQITVRFTVARDYRGGSMYLADPAKTGAAKQAAANAQSIVKRYASVSDYEKLTGYRDEICALVSYDQAAADNNTFHTDIDPWQLISVFDGNPDTNVVCEGYSKAFMYLCELTSFKKDVSCYLVNGFMGCEPHMWNIVTLSENNYLVDVTNSDSGTIGGHGGLFLAGAKGSVDGGYDLGLTAYVYDDTTKAIWGTDTSSILNLAETDYQYEEDTEEIELAAPELSVTNVASSGKIQLSWDAIDGAEKYQVYRSTSGKTGTFKRIYTTSKNRFSNTSVEPGKRYYYKVRAVDEHGETYEFSNTVSRLCDLEQPKIKLAIVASSGKPKVTWDAVDGAVKYEVYRSTSGKTGTYKKMYTTAGTSYTNTSATAGNKYYYKVRAVHSNTNANSAYTDAKYVTCDLKSPVISVKLKSSGKPNVTWAAVDGAVKYEVYRAASKSGTYKKVFTTTKTSYTNTGASAGKAYYYKVRAIHSQSAANSAFSAIKGIRAK